MFGILRYMKESFLMRSFVCLTVVTFLNLAVNTVVAKRKPEKIQAYRDPNPAGPLDTDAAH